LLALPGQRERTFIMLMAIAATRRNIPYARAAHYRTRRTLKALSILISPPGQAA
jgi:hypothetical protein